MRWLEHVFASTLDQVFIDTTEYKLYLVLPQENMMSLYDVDSEVALGFKDFYTTKFVFSPLNWQESVLWMINLTLLGDGIMCDTFSCKWNYFVLIAYTKFFTSFELMNWQANVMLGLFYPYMLDKLLGIIICVHHSGSFNCLYPSYSEMAFS